MTTPAARGPPSFVLCPDPGLRQLLKVGLLLLKPTGRMDQRDNKYKHQITGSNEGHGWRIDGHFVVFGQTDRKRELGRQIGN